VHTEFGFPECAGDQVFFVRLYLVQLLRLILLFTKHVKR